MDDQPRELSRVLAKIVWNRRDLDELGGHVEFLCDAGAVALSIPASPSGQEDTRT